MNEFYSLDSILKQMVYSRKTNPTVYQKYSNLLLSHRKESVIDYTSNAMIRCFLPDPTSEEGLIFLDPNSVTSFFINLSREYPWIIELELSHTDSAKRYRMALIFRSLFSLKKDLPTINVCRELLTQNSVHIWYQFLKLFTDSEPQIRIVCIQTTQILIETQIDEQIVSNLLPNLNKRLRDLESIIRSDSAVLVEECSQSETILNHNLMRHFVARIGDREPEVRQKVLICVSNVFHTIRRKYRKTELNFLYKLPTACLLRYQTIQSEEEKYLIEMVFVNNLIDLNADKSTQMHNLLKMICYCDAIGTQSISNIFRKQLELRTLFLKLIIYTERHDFELSLAEVYEKVAESLRKAFDYIENIDQLIENFHILLKNYDKNKIEDLKNVLRCETTFSCERSVEIIEEFFDLEQSVVDTEALMALKNSFSVRLGIGLIDSNALIELIRHLNSIDQRFSQRLAAFVILLSKYYSNYFEDEFVVTELLALPHIIIAYISCDSVIPHLNCTESLKQKIRDSLQNKIL